jgi:hypothetical protein
MGAIDGTSAAAMRRQLRKELPMNTLDPDTLRHVTGGVSSRCAASSDNAALTQSLASIQSSLSSATSNNNNNNQNNLLLPMVMMMAMNRRQTAVVAPGATVVG